MEIKSNKSFEFSGLEISESDMPPAQDLLRRLEAAGDVLRELIVQTKRLPRTPGLESHQELGRSLALAQSHLQTGFMWMRRSIEQPREF